MYQLHTRKANMYKKRKGMKTDGTGREKVVKKEFKMYFYIYQFPTGSINIMY